MPFEFSKSGLAAHPGLHFLARLSVKVKLALAFSLVMCTVLLTLWLLLQNQLASAARQQSEEVGTLLVNQSADAITELVITNDLVSLSVVLSQLVTPRPVLYAAVYNIDRQLIAEAGPASSKSLERATSFSAPIDLQDSFAGVLEITMLNTTFEEQTRTLKLLFAGVFLAGLAFVLATAAAVSGHLLTPARRLLLAFETPLEAQPLSPSSRQDEIRELEEAGMHMLQSYQQHLQLEAWRNESNQNWRKRHADIGILALEVVNFESVRSMLNPSTITRLLNNYYQLLEQVADLYEGTFFRFTGKSLLLAFDRQRCASPEYNAVCCGALFQELVKRHNAYQVDQASPVLKFRALVHSGPALITRTGKQESSCMALIGETIESILTSVHRCPEAELTISEEARGEAIEEYALEFRSLGDGNEESTVSQLLLQVITSPLEQIDPELPEQADSILPEDEHTHGEDR